ncbi:MAG: rod shape determining protein RodA [Verrucomicrobiales bacterium]|jgi:rod shape determining protein RodA
MTPLFRKFLGMNWLLVLNMFALIVFGVICIYSATNFKTGVVHGIWSKQVIFCGLGTLFFIVAALLDYRWVLWGGIPLYIIGIVLSIAALLGVGGGDGVAAHNAGLVIFGINVQPSQIAIAGGIIVMALVLGHLHKVHPIFRHHLLRLGIVGVVCMVPFGIVLLQGDFGSAIVWLPVAFSMLLVGSIPFRYIIVVSQIGLVLIPWAYFFGLKPHQKERIEVYISLLLDKKVDAQGNAYAAINIMKAVGSGGFNGKGFLAEKSVNNLGFIPQVTAHNDFIFAVLAEEFGFKGSILLLAGFALLLIQMLFIGFYSRDPIGRLITVGVVALFFAHIFQHVGMNILIMPITGIPLPFISYGGTFAVICMFLVGMVQSVWVHRLIADANQRSSGGNAFEPPAPNFG